MARRMVASNEKSTAHQLVGPILTSVRKTSYTGSRHKARHHDEVAETKPEIFADWPMFEDEVGDGTLNHGPMLDAHSNGLSHSVASTADAEPIVFIDQDKDAQTGAQKATEVGSANNVLVGG